MPGAVATFLLINTATGVLPLVFSRWSTAASQALSKNLRWKIQCGVGVSITLRIWATFNQAGSAGR